MKAYSHLSAEERIRIDEHYIRNWSLALDLKILVMTVRSGFRHKHAY